MSFSWTEMGFFYGFKHQERNFNVFDYLLKLNIWKPWKPGLVWFCIPHNIKALMTQLATIRVKVWGEIIHELPKKQRDEELFEGVRLSEMPGFLSCSKKGECKEKTLNAFLRQSEPLCQFLWTLQNNFSRFVLYFLMKKQWCTFYGNILWLFTIFVIM